jgi:hypothetical protein
MSQLTKHQLQQIKLAYTQAHNVWEILDAQEEPPKQLMFELSGSVAMLRSIIARETFNITTSQNLCT